MVTASALAISGFSFGQAAPAQAAGYPQQTWVFESPSGSDWTVPQGITEVIVGLRGGAGGDGDTRTHGRGAAFAVKIPVRAGDTLTVYAGKSAHGKSDYREGGNGYIRGGDGGKGSLTGSNGGGGGGASAVKLNGELVAVAGGGGGGGGQTANPTIKMTLLSIMTAFEASGGYTGGGTGGGTFEYRAGGVAGGYWSTATSNPTAVPLAGVGSKPGVPGQNGTGDASFAGYHKAGAKGGTAGFGTGGGGGGGGGGGWPSSGTGGGGGRTFWHFSGGAGGGAGSSWITNQVPGVVLDTAASYPEDFHYYYGPLADVDTVKIFLPQKTTTTLTGPATVQSNQPFSLRVRTADVRTPNSPLDGSVDLYREGVSGRIDYHATGGDWTFSVPGLSAGTYVFRADFRPSNDQRDYLQRSTWSSSTFTVNVEDPAPDPVPEETEVGTSTRVVLDNEPTTYGDSAIFSGSVQVSGPCVLNLKKVNFEVDGIDAGESVLLGPFEDRFYTLIPFVTNLSVGTHSVVARFDGTECDVPASTSALASWSEPLTVTIAPAGTVTEITSAPSFVQAFTPVDISASVTSTPAVTHGQAALLANGVPIEYAPLAADGTVVFSDVVLPWQTTELRAAFLGDQDGNFLGSESDPTSIEVVEIGTETTVDLSATEVRADETVSIGATVTTLDPALTLDPRGLIEILFDGEVVETISAGLDVDPEQNDGEARFELDVSDVTLGVHEVSARFVPAPGFGTSASGDTELRVLGIDTELRTSAAEVSGTLLHPAKVDLSVTVADTSNDVQRRQAAPGGPVEGYVQAYLGSEPFGDPVAIVDGVGQMVFSGLPVGAHELDLRFTPAEQGMLRSSAIVTARVTPESGKSDSAAHQSLTRTGMDAPGMVILGASAMLLLGAAGLVMAARRRRG